MSRSFLFVPSDSEKKLAKARDAGADALILDLEDSVAADAKTTARQMAAGFLNGGAKCELWVRINPLDTSDALADLRAVMPAAPAGIVLPKPERADDTDRLAKLLDVLEMENEYVQGQTRILPIATERPTALFHMDEYAQASRRLAGLTWGAEDLSTAIGATECRAADGRWLPPYELARSLCLFAATSASIPAIDTVFVDYRNLDGLASYAANARRDGFEGMLAIHPDQIAIINQAFVPSAMEIERAQRIVDLFADHPDAGALGLDGKMIDRPHLIQAKRVLETATSLTD